MSEQRTTTQRMNRGLSRWVDENLGGTGFLRESMRHIFPDHWSFMLGEIALYCFVVLVLTGIFMTFFFHPSGAEVTYQGSYEPLQGQPMSDAYRSVLHLSFDVKAGLLVRQIHHWAALVFVGALLLHISRMFFTGAYRRPRRINWLIGLTLLLLVMGNGFTGYSVPDDLLSGTGLRIAFSITESIPFIGPWLAFLMFGGDFPNPGFISRLYALHIFLIPLLIGGLLAVHMGILWRQMHTEYPGPGRDDRTIVGSRLFPSYALRTGGFFLLVAGMLAFLGAFFQVNPVWLYGPYKAWAVTSNAQPDWYVGWLEGALRMFPGWDITSGGYMLPALFWPAVFLPGLLFGFLYVWPWLDARLTGDRGFHNVLQRPCERPGRTALGAAILTFLAGLLLGGGDDVFASALNVSYRTLVWAFRAVTILLPPLVAAVVYWACRRSRA